MHRCSECTALHYAKLHDHLHAVETLLQFESNIEATDLSQFTPLYYSAAIYRHLDITKCLLQVGANTSARDDLDVTSPEMPCYAHDYLAIREQRQLAVEYLKSVTLQDHEFLCLETEWCIVDSNLSSGASLMEML